MLGMQLHPIPEATSISRKVVKSRLGSEMQRTVGFSSVGRGGEYIQYGNNL